MTKVIGLIFVAILATSCNEYNAKTPDTISVENAVSVPEPALLAPLGLAAVALLVLKRAK